MTCAQVICFGNVPEFVWSVVTIFFTLAVIFICGLAGLLLIVQRGQIEETIIKYLLVLTAVAMLSVFVALWWMLAFFHPGAYGTDWIMVGLLITTLSGALSIWLIRTFSPKRYMLDHALLDK